MPAPPSCATDRAHREARARPPCPERLRSRLVLVVPCRHVTLTGIKTLCQHRNHSGPRQRRRQLPHLLRLKDHLRRLRQIHRLQWTEHPSFVNCMDGFHGGAQCTHRRATSTHSAGKRVLRPEPLLPRERILRQTERAGEFGKARRFPRLPRPLTLQARGEMLDQLLDLRSGKIVRSPFDFGECAHGCETVAESARRARRR